MSFDPFDLDDEETDFILGIDFLGRLDKLPEKGKDGDMVEYQGEGWFWLDDKWVRWDDPVWGHEHLEEEKETLLECDCGGEKAQTTHSNWCKTNRKDDES